MNTLVQWDLTPIYPASDSPEFLNDLAWVTQEAKSLEDALAKTDVDIKTIIERYELVLDYLENLQAYSAACLTTDTKNEHYLKAVSLTDDASLAVQHLEVAFLNFLSSVEGEIIRRSAVGGDLQAYRYPLHQLLEMQKHLMTPDLEDLAADLARSGSDAFSRLQDAMGSSITTFWDDARSKTLVQLRHDASHADRSARERAFGLEIELLRQHEVSFAAALNGVKGTTLSLDTRRGYASPLDRSLHQCRIDRTILDTLISALEESLPLFRTYLKHKAKILGVESLAFYDLFAPVAKEEMQYTYEQAQQFIITQFSSFSEEMGLFAQNAFSERWIDSESRKGKVGGAYDTAFPLAQQSRILTNFDGTYSGVSTLAHELGHAWHDSVVLKKSHLLRTYPMTLAETASIFSEFLVFQGALKLSEGERRIHLIEHFLQDATQVCVDILSRYYFEMEIFERRKEGDLTAQQYCQVMEHAQRRTYGDALSVYHPYMWAVKGHYYSSDFSFYNYPYAFGQLFGLGLFVYSKKDQENFPRMYEQLLSYTGSLPSDEVASMAGIDLRDPNFYKEAIGVIAMYVKEFIDGSHY